MKWTLTPSYCGLVADEANRRQGQYNSQVITEITASDSAIAAGGSSVSSRPRFEELPDLLTPQDLMRYLPVGRNAIYELLNQQRIKNLRIGQKFVIPRTALRDFLDGNVE